jgi:HSP20 family protein
VLENAEPWDERSAQSNDQEELQQRRLERRLGRFHRRFIVPDTVDTENVGATGRNGVFEISIAKHA